MKKIIIAHGWSGSPDEPMLKWIREQMQSLNCEVIAPFMPHPDIPTIEDWVSTLGESAGEIDENTYFVGHSVGCQTTIRFLETLPLDKKVGGVLLIAPWFILTLENLDEGESPDVAKPWLETPIDFAKVSSHTDKIFAILSDNDPYVPVSENKNILEENLGAKTIIMHDKGHFTESDDVSSLPEAIDILKKMAE